ncbi:MAG: hypothetical protein PWQ09_18 [Candidatus Cloacimonadota bacterium]|jgi:hypothetical protein|nr:hypothetical protein [Candidatus Cloacimonadota bacterium]
MSLGIDYIISSKKFRGIVMLPKIRTVIKGEKNLPRNGVSRKFPFQFFVVC